MKFFDLHCDTADAMYYNKEGFRSNSCHVSLDRAAAFDKYVQLCAIFTAPELSDEDGWQTFLKIRENLLSECEKNGVEVLYSASELEKFNESGKKNAVIITVEDARILAGKIERVREMYELGVRVVTPLWGGKTCMGGSHDTAEGLTKFGKAAVREMAKVGIIPDISHASFKSADDILDICESEGISPVATHMNSYSICRHSRNLTDERFMRLVSLGGIAGVSLCPPHLVEGFSRGDTAKLEVIVPHFKKYEELSPSHVCFGCDMDGTSLPEGIGGLDGIPAAVQLLAENGFKPAQIEALSYDTAYSFMKNSLK